MTYSIDVVAFVQSKIGVVLAWLVTAAVGLDPGEHRLTERQGIEHLGTDG
jgi:hypothetical protein